MDDTPARGTSAINEIPIDHIHPNPDQPRRDFDNDSLAELAAGLIGVGMYVVYRNLVDGRCAACGRIVHRDK